jgi:ParB-like chromosome segregation protein Spo0J
MKQESLFEVGNEKIVEMARGLCEELARLPEEQRIPTLNQVRAMLHQVSPFRDEPVDLVQWVQADDVEGNSYNPNRVAPPEMKLLARSVAMDGYTQPIVGWSVNSHVEVVDGFHRARVGKEIGEVRRRVRGYLPVVMINASREDAKDRMAATIRHNRARGVHGVLPMTDIVAALLREGWSDDEVARELGMDADEVLRFKQNTGLPELFKNSDYGRAWE